MKKIKLILFALLITVPMLFVSAEEEDKLEVSQPERLVTSDGIIVESEFGSNDDGWTYYYRVTFTIPEDYEEESFIIAPEITDYIYTNYKTYLGNILGEPGDDFLVTITIVNNSKYQYDYEEESFEIYPDSYEGGEYKKVTVIDDDTTFNGNDIKNNDGVNSVDTIYRMCNTAIQAIFPYCKSAKNNKELNNYLSDEVLDAELIKLNYNGIEDLDKYYLDFYNNKYNTNYTNLNQFSKAIIREILGDRDYVKNAVIFLKNDAHELINFQSKYNRILNGLSTNDCRKGTIDNDLQVMNKLEEYLKSLGYDSVQDYLLFYLNSTYNDNATNLSEINAEASGVISFNGIEKTTYILETNANIIKLSYDNFYNNLFSYSLNGEDIDDEVSQDFSIGEYMRDEDKGDDIIKENVGTLLFGDSKSLEDTSFKVNGDYTNNAYQNYNFNVHMHMKFNALMGDLIVRYVDREGNELTDTIFTSGMVGKEYITLQKEFDGYVFDKVEGEVIGNYIDGTINVTYIYMNAMDAKGGDVNENVIEELPPQTGVNVSNGISILNIIIFIVSIVFKINI